MYLYIYTLIFYLWERKLKRIKRWYKTKENTRNSRLKPTQRKFEKVWKYCRGSELWTVTSILILFFFLSLNSFFFDKVIMLKFVGIGKTFWHFKGGFALLTDIAGISVGVVPDSTQFTSDGKADCYAVFELAPSGCQKTRCFWLMLSQLQFVRL